MKNKKIYIFLFLGIFIGFFADNIFYDNKENKKYEIMHELKVILIDKNIRTDDYDENFWCDESDGRTLNIYIKNSGTHPVQHRITHGNSAVRSKGTIKPGKSVQLRLGPDRSGRWNIDVYTTDGSRMDVKVETRQF